MCYRYDRSAVVTREPAGSSLCRCFTLCTPVGMIKTVEYRTHVLQQRVVVRLKRACSGNDRREAGRFGYRNATDVEVMHERAQARQRRIVLKSEACNQDLESHFRVNVGEACTVEVKADSSFRTIFRQFQPDKLSLRIDESTDQPRRADAINPQALSGCPNASSIVLAVAAQNLAFGGMRLLGRELGGQSRLRIQYGAFELSTRFAREEIHGAERRRLASRSGQASTCLALIELRKFLPQRVQRCSDRLVVGRAVKECSERVALSATRVTGELEEVGRPAAALDLMLLSLEHLTRGIRHRQHVHAVAQGAGP